MRVVGVDEIRAALDIERAIEAIKKGFIAYSSGSAMVPPVGHLDFENPRGECHIKYGYILDESTFLIKVATGFYENHKLGLPNSNGMMLLFSAETGQPLALFRDEGYLTDVRTAIAGALSARYLANGHCACIGIVGGGIQARFQLEYLKYATSCRQVLVWARRAEQAAEFVERMAGGDFKIEIAGSAEALCRNSDLIVTTTAAGEPIVMADWVEPGTHITAIGSDGSGKQEIDAAVFGKANLCVVDSRSQCSAFAESHHALAAGYVRESDLVELGDVLSGEHAGRASVSAITIADLTGVAVQDIAIAGVVWKSLSA